MSNYSKYYTSSDVSVYVENSDASTVVLIDTLLSVGWNEQLTSSQTHGLGEQTYGFINAGNLMVNGFLEINFTDHEYLYTILQHSQPTSSASNTSVSDAMNTLSDSDLLRYKSNKNKQEKAPINNTGINNFPQGWSLRVVFNNGNLYHDDIDKSFIIDGCKIVSSQMHTSVSKPGQVTQLYSFLAKEVKTQ